VNRTRWRAPLQLGVAVAAAVALACMGFALPDRGLLVQRAVVEAGQTFTLMSVEAGQYRTTLQDGRPARGAGLVEERQVVFARSDLIRLTPRPGLATGDLVTPATPLADLETPSASARLAELEAERDALVHQRALLEAGGRAEEAALAARELRRAEAARDGLLPARERARTAHAQGAISDADREAAEMAFSLAEAEVEVARANLALQRASARPEALAEVDARVAALEARVEEARTQVAGEVVVSPIRGVLELGGKSAVMRVYDLDRVYLRVPIPEGARNRLAVGAPVEFLSTAIPDLVFRGEIVDLSEDASALNGVQVFWGSVEVANPDGLLRSGMSGSATIALDGEGLGLVGQLWREVSGL
jgi:HlyD family secretion protein